MSKRNRSGWVSEGCGYLPLTQGQIVRVDPDLIPMLEEFTWHAQWIPHMQRFYACSTVKVNGKHKRIYMHRLILEMKGRGEVADHISGDTLDNQRANLRWGSRAQNAHNRKMLCTNTTGCRGLRFHAGKWEAAITHLGTHYYLGRFSEKKDAIEVVGKRYQELRGEFYPQHR